MGGSADIVTKPTSFEDMAQNESIETQVPGPEANETPVV